MCMYFLALSPEKAWKQYKLKDEHTWVRWTHPGSDDWISHPAERSQGPLRTWLSPGLKQNFLFHDTVSNMNRGHAVPQRKTKTSDGVSVDHRGKHKGASIDWRTIQANTNKSNWLKRIPNILFIMLQGEKEEEKFKLSVDTTTVPLLNWRISN